MRRVRGLQHNASSLSDAALQTVTESDSSRSQRLVAEMQRSLDSALDAHARTSSPINGRDKNLAIKLSKTHKQLKKHQLRNRLLKQRLDEALTAVKEANMRAQTERKTREKHAHDARTALLAQKASLKAKYKLSAEDVKRIDVIATKLTESESVTMLPPLTPSSQPETNFTAANGARTAWL
jgi:hypothetical protein